MCSPAIVTASRHVDPDSRRRALTRHRGPARVFCVPGGALAMLTVLLPTTWVLDSAASTRVSSPPARALRDTYAELRADQPLISTSGILRGHPQISWSKGAP